MVRRKNSPLYDSFLLCRNSIRKDLSHIAHKRRNVRFKGLRRVHTPPQPLTAHTAAHRVKQGAFRVGGAITTLGPFRTVRNLCARSGQKSILCHLCMDRGNVGEKQRAFGTAMRLCASLFRGVAAPLGCVIFSVSVEIAACMPCAQGLSVCARRGVVSLPSARFTCC